MRKLAEFLSAILVCEVLSCGALLAEEAPDNANKLLAAERAKNADLIKQLGAIDIWLSKERKRYFDLLAFAPGLGGAVKLAENGLPPMGKAKAYDPVGQYLNYGDTVYKDSALLKIDPTGLPTVKYGDSYHYNPVTIAQFALDEYCRAAGPSDKFVPATNYLLGMMGDDGAFRYDFPFERYATGEMYQPGWISGMAQGQAISVFVRAYHFTNQDKYLDAARKALDFMLLSADKDGPMTTLERFTPEPSKLPFIMEYPQSPPVYTLNGYMFSMLGLHDFAAVAHDTAIQELAQQSSRTLKVLLPYYDMGSISAYDLSYITVPVGRNGKRSRPHVSPEYHAVHISLLWALYKLTADPALKETAERWTSYFERKS